MTLFHNNKQNHSMQHLSLKKIPTYANRVVELTCISCWIFQSVYQHVSICGAGGGEETGEFITQETILASEAALVSLSFSKELYHI